MAVISRHWRPFQLQGVCRLAPGNRYPGSWLPGHPGTVPTWRSPGLRPARLPVSGHSGLIIVINTLTALYCFLMLLTLLMLLVFRDRWLSIVSFASLSGRLHVPIVGPTGRSDWSVRLVAPTIVSCKRFVWPSDRRSKNQTCLISSDCRSDCRSVWTLRPTGRTDWRRRYYNQLTGHIDLIDIMWAVRLQSVQPVCPTGLTDSRT